MKKTNERTCFPACVLRGTLSDGGRHNFNRSGVVVLPGHNISSEKALELAIESGAADVQETEDEEEKPLLKVTKPGPEGFFSGSFAESKKSLIILSIFNNISDIFLLKSFKC